MPEDMQPPAIESDSGLDKKYSWPEELIVYQPETLVGQQLVFKTTADDEKNTRSATVEIKAIKQVFHGGVYARWLAEVEAAIAQDNSIALSHTFVLKNFKTNEEQQLNPAYATETPAEHSLEGYQLLRKNGLKTWSTYRISEDGQMILMTNGNLDGKHVLSGHNDEASAFGRRLKERPLEEISSREQMIYDAFHQIELADKVNIYLHADSWAFILDESDAGKRRASLDLILGDVDNIFEYGGSTIKINLKHFRQSYKYFLEEFTDNSVRDTYLTELDRMILEKYKIITSDLE